MKAKCFLFNGLSVAVTLSFLLTTSCVNQIADEESIIETGSIPIQLSTNIFCIKSRVMNNQFQNKDTIGLYVLTQPNTMEQERYIDNVILMHSNTDSFQSKDTLYYPKQDLLCDFISYYPYQEEGFISGKSKLNVRIYKNQSNVTNYAQSDFIIAKKKDIKATNHPIELTYEHKTTKLKIRIQLKDKKKDINEVLYTYPKIYLNGFYTKASYNLNEDSFSNYQDKSTIIPYGEWQLNEKQLIGKEVNIFPQEINQGLQTLTIDLDNENYSCLFPSNLILKKGVINELTINFTPTKGIEVESIHPLIADWEKGASIETENKTSYQQINLASLSFETSNIYQILSKEREPLYEVTKELLCSKEKKEQAIIAYPIKTGKVDLTNGVVLHILNNNKAIHGGLISWNELDNSYEYTEGTQKPISSFFITKTNKIAFAPIDKPQTVYLSYKVLLDKRGDERIEYPITKIGTQYWMCDELRTDYTTDGIKLEKTIDSINEEAPSIVITKNHPNHYFYNDKAVMSNKLAPTGWKIFNENDWKRLMDYLQNDITLLQNGTWAKQTRNNLSGFNAQPNGAFANSRYTDNNAAYWCVTETNPSEVNKNSIAILGQSNKLINVPHKPNKALSIRCLKKQ